MGRPTSIYGLDRGESMMREPDVGSRALQEPILTGPKSDDDPELAGDSGEKEPVAADEGVPLLPGHLAERCDKKIRDRIFTLLCLSALVDTMGASLLSPAYAMAVSRAPGSVLPAEGIHKDAFPFVPVSFSLAVNMISSAMVLGGVFSSLTMGPVSDKLGRKPLIIVGLLGGAVGYFLMWLSASVLKDYYLFLGAMFVNGLFSGTKSVMTAYFADVYSAEEFGAKQPIFGMAVLTGGTAGGIFGGIIISASGSLWLASWAGVVASVFFALAVSVMMPGPEKNASAAQEAAADAKKTDAPQPDGASPPPSTTGTVRRILLVAIFAGAIDALGDEGNRFARSTIMPQTFPVTKDPSIMSLVGSSNVRARASHSAPALYQRSMKRVLGRH